MFRSAVIIGCLTFVYLGIIVFVFANFGTPWDTRGKELDKKRISDFQALSQQINSYYQLRRILPQSLADFPSSSRKDQESQKDYDYKIVSATSYQLCATFAFASEPASDAMSKMYSLSLLKTHKKGYDCLDYSVGPISVPAPPQPPKPTVTPIGEPMPVPSPLPNTLQIFVTSDAFDGKLGGLAGADRICQSAADTASMSGKFKAWLSTENPNFDIKTLLRTATLPYYRLDGVKVADSLYDLTDGTIQAPINRTEKMQTLPEDRVWTGTRDDGLHTVTGSCYGWTASAYPYAQGYTGVTSSTNSLWTYDPGYYPVCSAKYHLYCLQDQ